MKITIPFIVFLSFVMIPAFATIHNVTIQPDGAASKDAAIWEGMPDTNYGDYEELLIGHDNGRCVTFIKFNGLDAYSGVTVLYAGLNLYTTYEWGDSLSDDNQVGLVTNSWDEATITWNNAPAIDITFVLLFDAPVVDTWTTINVTDFVQDWLDGTYSHYGFAIFNLDAINTGRYFASGEYTPNPEHRPYIFMEYEYTNVTPASLGEIKVTFK